MALNEEPLEYKSLASSPLWTWSGINLEGSRRSGVKLFHFDKGKHIIKLLPRESLYLDMLLVTNDPLLMGE
jgi:hypothetical protein